MSFTACARAWGGRAATTASRRRLDAHPSPWHLESVGCLLWTHLRGISNLWDACCGDCERRTRVEKIGIYIDTLLPHGPHLNTIRNMLNTTTQSPATLCRWTTTRLLTGKSSTFVVTVALHTRRNVSSHASFIAGRANTVNGTDVSRSVLRNTNSVTRATPS